MTTTEELFTILRNIKDRQICNEKELDAIDFFIMECERQGVIS